MVSCIMPTRNRRPFVGQAIAQFLAQDYPERELIVVDDGDDAIADLLPLDSRIRLIRLERPATVGAKRNIACDAAAGDVIAHWDDDDWMAGRRLSCQAKALEEHSADICGLTRLYFYDDQAHRAWLYTYPPGGLPWLHGGTMCYRKALWSACPFQDVNEGEDTRWIRALRDTRPVALDDLTLYVARIHEGNRQRRPTWRSPFVPCAPEVVDRSMRGDGTRQLAAMGEAPVQTPLNVAMGRA